MKSLLMKTVPNVILRKVSRQVLIARKNSPHIFFGLGIVGTVTSAVMACKATLKLGETLDEVQKEINELTPPPPIELEIDAIETPEVHEARLVHNVEVLHVYAHASLKIVKLYAPAVIVGGASMALLTGSHVQMTRRNSALMAAYAALQESYDKYRERVRQEMGEEKDFEFAQGAKKEIVKKSDDSEEKGFVLDGRYVSGYAKFFDEYSENWVKNPEYNRIFLEVQQAYANHKLVAFGHVFLNEVYDMLDIPRTKAGSVVGWVKNSEEGDNYISFGMHETWASAFLNGYEPSVLLDFNVDGVIYDKI